MKNITKIKEPVEVTIDGGTYWYWNSTNYVSDTEAWDAYNAYLTEVEEEED